MMVTKARTVAVTVETLVILVMIQRMIQITIQRMIQTKIPVMILLMTLQVDPSQVMTNLEAQETKMMTMLMIKLYRQRFTNNSHQMLGKVLNKINMKKMTLRQN